MVITFVVLLLLNVYCSRTSQDLFYRSKESSMVEKCLLASDAIAELDVINTDNVEDVINQMGSLQVSRLLVTDTKGMTIYDSTAQDLGRYALMPEIVDALDGNDVFYSHYQDGTIHSHAATPIISYGTTIGCVYMMEYDAEQGQLIRSLQGTILQITLILELAIVLFTLIFSNSFSRRVRQIMNSMRIIQQGDYTQKLELGGHDELTFLGDEFNDLTEKLHTSEQKRRRFVSDASHELKTPLASIKLLTDSILQNDMDMETVREFVEDIGNEADRLNRTTAKLLSLTRVDGKPTEESEIIPMVPTIERVVHMLRGIARQNDISIQTQVLTECPILMLEDDFYQVVFNLVENGIKYNIPGGSLFIRLHREDDNAVLEISDTGMGIPEDATEHIFERFFRVDKARSRATGGSGLGLSIVRAIVQRYRGEISVSSKLGEGTTFTVIFPIFDTEEDIT